jgi:hypothetical protein
VRLDHLLSTSLEPLSGILVMRTDALLTFRLAAVLRRLEKQSKLSITPQLLRPRSGGPVAQVVRALC